MIEILERNKNADFDEKVKIFNEISQQLYNFLGLNHPVLNVQLRKAEQIKSNSYNPNKVAPPEMKLLKKSIEEDGVTMPVVIFDDEVVDGYHRTTTIINNKNIYDSLKGYIPVSMINKDISNRMASTIRHNRARGSHDIELMTNIVSELVKAGQSDTWIMKHIGMDADEVLRLKQLSGIIELFKNKEFSKSLETI